MPRKLCIEAGCPWNVTGGIRCARHSAAHEAQRGAQREKYRDPAYRRTRNALLRGGIPCAECGSFEDLTVDHKIPLVLGGTNDPHNLQVLCRRCNSTKGAVSR